ncbi:DUF3795 domain-containing protein [Candidatus Neomarinimicrobiota bacterium]
MYPEIGICGLSCRLCPRYYTVGTSKCDGCKSASRMAAGCPFITCALKNRGIEFCWQCTQHGSCEKWHKHRAFGAEHDSFKCYQKLEDNIGYISRNGLGAFKAAQDVREQLLGEMLKEFNEGRSKSYYCIAATVLEIGELEGALAQARAASAQLAIKDKSRLLHLLLDEIAEDGSYYLKLRK